jgi:gamma-glutamylcysteine synthetase
MSLESIALSVLLFVVVFSVECLFVSAPTRKEKEEKEIAEEAAQIDNFQTQVKNLMFDLDDEEELNVEEESASIETQINQVEEKVEEINVETVSASVEAQTTIMEVEELISFRVNRTFIHKLNKAQLLKVAAELGINITTSQGKEKNAKTIKAEVLDSHEVNPDYISTVIVNVLPELFMEATTQQPN